MARNRWIYLALLGSACGSTAVDTTQDDRLTALEQKNSDLEQRLTAATEALTTATAALSNLEAHERLVAAEVIDDGLGADGVSDDLAGLSEQLATSRVDALEGGASASCTDICVTDAELALTLVDYATDADIAPLATRVEVEAGDAAGQQWVIDQDYLTSADLSAYVTVGWVADQDFATVYYVDTQDALLRQWVEDQDYATDADLAALAGRVSTIESDYLRAVDLAPYATQAWVVANYPEQAELDAAELTLDDHEARISALEAADLPSRLDAAELELVDLRADLGGYARVIANDRVIRVPSDQPTIQAALDSVQDAVIHARTRVDILVEPAGCVAQAGPIMARHRDGARIHIRSESGDPTQCVLTFPDVGITEDNYGGVLVKQGYTLGELSGFTLRGPAGGVLPAAGLDVDQRSALLDVNDMVFDGWIQGPGMAVYDGSFADGDSLRATSDAAGFSVSGNSTAYLGHASASGSSSDGFAVSDGAVVYASAAASSTNVGNGFVADRSGLLVAANATSQENGASGFASLRGSVVSARASQSFNNVYSGFYAVIGAVMDVPSAVADGNDQPGFYGGAGSAIVADEATSTGNGSSGFQVYGGSTLSAVHASSTDNASNGVTAVDRSWVDAEVMTISNCGSSGVAVLRGGYVFASGSAISSNGAGDTNITAYTDYPDASFIER